MEIIAKPGTALEQTIKAMRDKIKKSFDEANDMVEKMAGFGAEAADALP